MRRGLIGAALGVLASCTRPNPDFDLGATGGRGGTGDTGAGETSSSGSSETSSSGSPGPTPAHIYVFAGPLSNGSVDEAAGEGVASADESCKMLAGDLCDTPPRAFLFAEPGHSTPAIAGELGLDVEAIVLSAEETELAATLEQFIEGPHALSLVAAGVLGEGTELVWTGLSPEETENCSEWTSGNDSRNGGAGTTEGDLGWAGADVADCGTELPFLCLCE